MLTYVEGRVVRPLIENQTLLILCATTAVVMMGHGINGAHVYYTCPPRAGRVRPFWPPPAAERLQRGLAGPKGYLSLGRAF